MSPLSDPQPAAPPTFLITDLCVASNRPVLEEFRLVARAMRSCNRAIDRMNRAQRTTRRDEPLWVLEEERRIYMRDVFDPTYSRYHELFAAGWEEAPEALYSIDRLYFPPPRSTK